MKKLNLKNVTMGTWVRTIVLLIALVNQLFVIFGKTSKTIDIDQWYEYVSYALTVITSITGWWKNNSFTDKAQEADNILNGGSKDE